ncbi:NAD(P)-dependent oxidoreductase [Aeromicrobium sp.]|uniref:NAD(P)-dependent oxidoreductase n=1 Tax=Aeromicrobium sp. TaxID=1871063 RepID=UPI003C3F473E
MAQDEQRMTIGWVGVGRMGFALAQRLLDAGHDVSVYNRTRSKAEPLTAHGAKIVDRPVELADRDVVFVMVSASDDLEDVTIGPDGLLTASVTPQVIVDTSTVSATVSGKIRRAADDRGSAFLAAPVSGSPKVVASGKLSFVVSGPRDTFDRVEPLFAELGRAATYVGDDEVARIVKICHNVFLGVVTQSMAEITVLAEKAGVDRAAFLAFLNDSVMGSTFSRYKSPAFVNLDFTPSFTPVLLRKDFDLGLASARELGVSMPVAALAAELVTIAINTGHSAEDFATLLLEQARRSGLEMTPEDVEVDDGLGTTSDG